MNSTYCDAFCVAIQPVCCGTHSVTLKPCKKNFSAFRTCGNRIGYGRLIFAHTALNPLQTVCRQPRYAQNTTALQSKKTKNARRMQSSRTRRAFSVYLSRRKDNRFLLAFGDTDIPARTAEITRNCAVITSCRLRKP